MKYLVKVPATMEQGNYKCLAEASFGQTMRQDALQQYNSARDHDGLPPIKRMPKGTTYEPAKVLFSV